MDSDEFNKWLKKGYADLAKDRDTFKAKELDTYYPTDTSSIFKKVTASKPVPNSVNKNRRELNKLERRDTIKSRHAQRLIKETTTNHNNVQTMGLRRKQLKAEIPKTADVIKKQQLKNEYYEVTEKLDTELNKRNDKYLKDMDEFKV